MSIDRRDFIKLGSAAAAGGMVAPGVPALAQDLKTVRTISIPTDAAKQLLYAQKAGLFRKHGIQVDIAAMGSGAAIFAAIVGGTADFGSGAVFSVFTAYGHGVPLRIVAPISIYDTNHCDTWMIVDKDAPIRSARDLNGKIMGADTPDDIYVNAVRVWMQQRGGDGTSLKAVELKPSEQFTALTTGRIDVVVLKPPYLTVAMQSGKVRVIGKPLDVIAPRFLLSCWVATADYIEKNPGTTKGFVDALMESSHWVNRHQPETIDMVAQFSKQDPAVLAQGVRSIIAESISLGDIQKPLDFATAHGVIDRHYDAKAVLSAYMPMSRTS